MPFGFVSDATRRTLGLGMRSELRKEIAKYARSGKTHPDILRRVSLTEKRTIPAQERYRYLALIRSKIGLAIPKDDDGKEDLLRKTIKLVDHYFFMDTIEDGILAWTEADPGREFHVSPRLAWTKVVDGVSGLTDFGRSQASIGVDFFTLLGTDDRSTVGNVPCKIKTDCLILLTGHECAHGFDMLYRVHVIQKYNDYHNPVFLSLIRRLFGMTAADHTLADPFATAAAQRRLGAGIRRRRKLKRWRAGSSRR